MFLHKEKKAKKMNENRKWRNGRRRLQERKKGKFLVRDQRKEMGMKRDEEREANELSAMITT